MKTGIDLSLEEIGALEQLMQKASVTLQQAVNNGYRPEFSQDLELYAGIRKKLGRKPEVNHHRPA
ncbi:MAG: hypothetical protein ACJASY_002037 [Halioglobus sp.]|jgi:hypothetical protein